MNDIVIFKATDNVDNRINLTDMGEELVAETFALGSALYKTCDINEFNDSGGELLGLMEISQPVQPLIRHGNHTHIGVNGAESIIIRRNTCVGNSIEQSGLANIGQSHDTQLHIALNGELFQVVLL